jgi:group I intron endonuclease
MFNIENSGIYKIISKRDGKYYPGSSKKLLKVSGNRKSQHFTSLKRNQHHCSHLQNAYNKYGKDNFEFIIIKNNIPEHQLLIEEQKLLNIAQTQPEMCYTRNYTAGRVNFTKEIRDKISKSTKQLYKNGYINPMKDKYHKLSTKIKISLARAKQNGVNHPMFGKHHTTEAKNKISEKRKDKTMYQFRHIITNKIFKGIRYNFIQKFNLNHKSVSQLIRGKQNSTKNWILIT